MKERGLFFGLKCGELLGTYDPHLRSLKTLEQSLFEGWIEYLAHLPKSGMMLNGKIFEQRTWVRRIKEREYGLLPTPQASDWKDRFKNMQAIRNYYKSNHQKHLSHELLIRGATYKEVMKTYEKIQGFLAGWTELKESEIQLYLR